MNLNHSVVIVGWGVDEKTGTKYWILRNSYGRKWGMNGDFLVRRGENDFGIESETTGYDVVLCEFEKCWWILFNNNKGKSKVKNSLNFYLIKG